MQQIATATMALLLMLTASWAAPPLQGVPFPPDLCGVASANPLAVCVGYKTFAYFSLSLYKTEMSVHN